MVRLEFLDKSGWPDEFAKKSPNIAQKIAQPSQKSPQIAKIAQPSQKSPQIAKLAQPSQKSPKIAKIVKIAKIAQNRKNRPKNRPTVRFCQNECVTLTMEK
jgi:hypothetical protein